MTIEVVTIPKAELEALIQASVREAYREGQKELREEVEAIRGALRGAQGVLSRGDVAAIMGIQPEQVSRHHAKGLRFSQPGKRAVYLLKDVIEYVESARAE